LQSKRLIVGIDPGSTIGVALLDLKGRKSACISFEGGGISEAARVIERHGTPSLVACDVTPPPEMAVRLASYFSCILFVPNRQIREEEKREVASGAGMKNNHERDAYCAAVYAYRFSANKLRQIDSLMDVGEEDKDKLKHLILRGYKLQDAFLEIAAADGEATSEDSVPRAPEAKVPAPSLDALHGRVSSLARENANLRLMTERLEEEKRALAWRMRLLENGVRQRVLRDGEVRRLRFHLSRLIDFMDKRKKKKHGADTRHRQDTEGGKREFRTAQNQPQPARRDFSASGGKGADLNNLGEELDLEKLVAEYRKGRA